MDGFENLLLLPMGGTAAVTSGADRHLLHGGDALFCRGPEKAPAFAEKPSADMLWLGFSDAFFASVDPQGRLLAQAPAVHVARQTVPPHLIATFGGKTEAADAALERIHCLALAASVLLSPFSAAERPTENQQRIADAVMAYIKDHLCERFSLDALASALYLNKSYICRAFRTASGMTIGAYLTLQRLELASQLLHQGHSPSSAGRLCGFGDYSSFYRAYTKRFGHSPRAAR